MYPSLSLQMALLLPVLASATFRSSSNNLRGLQTTDVPTPSPTTSPTGSPTGSSTGSPTVSPTTSPTASPTVTPTVSPTGSPTVQPTPAPTVFYTMAPTEHYNPNDYNSSTLEIITFTDTYDEPWVTFDADQSTAYSAISSKITTGLTSDIRSVYYSHREDTTTFQELLDENEQELRNQVKDTCDDSCFTTVSNQISEELALISFLSPWIDGYANTYEATSSHLQGWLSSAKSLLGISPTTIVKAASSSGSTWLTLIADSLNIAGNFCPPPCNGVMKTASTLLSMSMSLATSSTSQNANTQADTDLDLQYEEVMSTVISFYDNLTAIADDQTQAITGNWGKLQAWHGLIWPTNTTLTPTQIGAYMNTTDDGLQYQAYEWLFPSKYELCMQVTDCYSPLCTNAGGASCCTNNDYNYCTASEIKSTKTSKSLGTESGNQKDCADEPPYGCGGCKNHGKTCNVEAWMWMCEVGNDKAGPPVQVLDVLNGNNYASEEKFIQNDNFEQTVLDACIGKWNDKNCSSAGMILPVNDIGECVEHNQPDDCGGSGYCNAFSY